MTNETLRYWVGFNRISGIGASRINALLAHFNGDLAAAWHAPEKVVSAVLNNKGAYENWLKARRNADLDADVAAIGRIGAQVVTLQDAHYPKLLRQIAIPPPVLYYRGTLEAADDVAIGIVGTREATEYGLQAARALAIGLVKNQVTIVSGLAKGIDTAAHKAAIFAGGRTFALLGHGIETVYPKDNADLAQAIAQHGALITEFPIGMRADAGNFPMRNRLISGLSLGVVVVEAGARSGALGTARHALEQSREVFAVPGSIFSEESKGTNILIQAGEAKLVTNAHDILDEFLLNTPLFSASLVPDAAALPVAPRRPETDADQANVPPIHAAAPTEERPTGKDVKASRTRGSNTPQPLLPLANGEPDPQTAVPPPAIDYTNRRPDEILILEALRAGPQYIDELCATTGLSAARVTSLLTVLELNDTIQQPSPRRYSLG